MIFYRALLPKMRYTDCYILNATSQIWNRQNQNCFQGFDLLAYIAEYGAFIVTDFKTIVKKGDRKKKKKKRQASFKKLDTLIKARNVSFYKLSEELGMARSTFSDWKSGKSMPKTDKLIKIANYFGVEVSYFIE